MGFGKASLDLCLNCCFRRKRYGNWDEKLHCKLAAAVSSLLGSSSIRRQPLFDGGTLRGILNSYAAPIQ